MPIIIHAYKNLADGVDGLDGNVWRSHTGLFLEAPRATSPAESAGATSDSPVRGNER